METATIENILTKDVNFNEEEFEEIVKENKGREYMVIPQYRYILLQKRDVENEDYMVSKDNFERLFLETFTDGQYKRLLNRMKYNGWIVRNLFCEVCRTGALVDNISTVKCYV